MNKDQDHASDQPVAENDDHEGSPKFGRLLLVLASAVLLIVVITFVTDAYYSN